MVDCRLVTPAHCEAESVERDVFFRDAGGVLHQGIVTHTFDPENDCAHVDSVYEDYQGNVYPGAVPSRGAMTVFVVNPVSGGGGGGGGGGDGLTNAQLRASPVPVSGPLTDTQLRATAVSVSAASLPLPTGAATSALQTSGNTLIGAVNETAPENDNASSGLNGRLQRVALNITRMRMQLPWSVGAKNSASSFSVVLATDQTALDVNIVNSMAGVLVQAAARGVAGGGLQTSRVILAGGNNATVTRAAVTNLYGWYLFNSTDSVKYVKLYNLATPPVVASSTPKFTIAVPPVGGTNIDWSVGLEFSVGLSYVVTDGLADTDSAYAAAGSVTGFLAWA